MTSLDRKNRAVNAHDIASQLNINDKKSLKSLKSKNSELLAKYREKARSDGSPSSDQETKEILVSDAKNSDNGSEQNLIPKVSSESFRGVIFDEEEDKTPTVDKGRKRKNYQSRNQLKDVKGKDKKNSRFKKFKPFHRSEKDNKQKKQ